MYSLVMCSVDWNSKKGSIPLDRISKSLYAYSNKPVLKEDGSLDLEELQRYPCLFMQNGMKDELAYVGSVCDLSIADEKMDFTILLDPHVSPIQNNVIYEDYKNHASLGVSSTMDFSQKDCWTLKYANLYQFWLYSARNRLQRPKVFQIEDREKINAKLVSVMMPFDETFSEVYRGIQQAVGKVGLDCKRVDEIWNNHTIIQDIVQLIDHARIVVCDCTGRNPNVFYEAGIAHTLGREVILIAQKEDDIPPFDLRHLRFTQYSNDTEGVAKLTESLESRMRTLIEKPL